MWKDNVVEGLAMKILNGECPQSLSEKRILSLDMTSIVETNTEEQFERLKVILKNFKI